MSAGAFILALVTAERLIELVIANRNTKALLARGAVEVGRSHYPIIVLLHALWLGTLWWLAPGRPIAWTLMLLFALLQLARVWVLATLGSRWTTRIIVLPNASLVTNGPFRFVRHPNYMVVIGEIALLPLAFGLWQVALIFSAANALVLALRITVEERALRGGDGLRNA